MKKIQRVIYRATHQQSEHGKLGYIGCALYGMEERRKVHLRDANRGTFTSMTFHRAIRKYGTKIWHWEVLESGFSDHKSMLEAEKKWIKQNGTKFSGYNLTDGGEGVVGKRQYPMSEQQKQKLRIANLGKKQSAETIAKRKWSSRNRVYGPEWGIMMSRVAKEAFRNGARRGMLGKHRSEATKRQISENQKGKPKSEETKKKMKLAWERRRLEGRIYTPSVVAMLEKNFAKGRLPEAREKAKAAIIKTWATKKQNANH